MPAATLPFLAGLRENSRSRPFFFISRILGPSYA
ncbi:Uncharacterised protein [Bordetella holmesii]|nr:Uncharacterised protein [Bordetella holmesii]